MWEVLGSTTSAAKKEEKKGTCFLKNGPKTNRNTSPKMI
jgi:hypothetical protein